MWGCVLLGVFLVLILCHQSLFSCETVVIEGMCLEETTKNWTEASDSCTLAVFNTSLSVGVFISGLPILDHRRPLVQRTESHDIHWIGATGEFTPWFKLIGCFLYFVPPSFSRKLTSTSSIGPVAECHQICEVWNENYKEFGINGTHCFCRENTKTELGSVPNKTCKLQNSGNFLKDLVGPKYDAGQAGDYNGIAMYRKMNDVTYIEDSLVECLIETEDGNETYPCDATDSMGYTWTESLKHQGIDYNKLPRWTPYLRRLIISDRKGNSALQDGTVCIGVRYQSEAYEPIPLPCSATYTSLCQTDLMTGTSTPRTGISGHGTSKGHQITDSSPVDRHNDSNETPDSTLPLIIGSVVGGLFCIIIVVIIIVIFIKRRRPNKKENTHPAPTENVYYTEMKEDRKSQLKMKKEEPSHTVNNTDYDTMMSVNKEKITDDSEEYGKLLPNGEADVYNHTWDKPITEQLTDHVYSSTVSGNDANVYDHTDTSNTDVTKDTEEKRTVLNRKDENLYDHTEAKYADKIE